MEYKHAHPSQTLAHPAKVDVLDMRICPRDHRHALLITGDYDGQVYIYKTALAQLKGIRFILLNRFCAHTWTVSALHFHFSKPVFVSASVDEDMKIWSFKDGMSPLRLVKCIPQLSIVCCVKFSSAGLLAVGCENGMLRVYAEAPLYSLLWSFQQVSTDLGIGSKA